MAAVSPLPGQMSSYGGLSPLQSRSSLSNYGSNYGYDSGYGGGYGGYGGYSQGGYNGYGQGFYNAWGFPLPYNLNIFGAIFGFIVVLVTTPVLLLGSLFAMYANPQGTSRYFDAVRELYGAMVGAPPMSRGF